MSSHTPEIPWIEKLRAENPGCTDDQVMVWLVSRLCDPVVRIEDDPAVLGATESMIPPGWDAIVDAEGEVVCMVPRWKAAEMARLLNIAAG